MKEKSYSPTFDCVWIAANLLLCSVAFSQSPTHADVTYGAGQEVVDMYLAKSPAPTPIYIWGHAKGQTYKRVSKDAVSLCLDAGYSFLSIEANDDNNDGIQDLYFKEPWLKILDFVIANAAKYNIDPENIFIGGRSLGSIGSFPAAMERWEDVRGVYSMQALPTGGKQHAALVGKNSPPCHLIYRGARGSGNHDPLNGIMVQEAYRNAGIADRFVIKTETRDRQWFDGFVEFVQTNRIGGKGDQQRATQAALKWKSREESAGIKPTQSLHQAAANGDIDGVKALLVQGVDINVKDDGGRTPLHLASLGGHQELVKLLISKGADVNAKEDRGNLHATPLHHAVHGGHRDVVETLLVHGADANIRDRLGQTPLDLANRRRRTEIVGLLRKHGAKELNQRRPQRRQSEPQTQVPDGARLETDIAIITHVRSTAGGEEGIAVSIIPPKKPRYETGAPVAISVSGGHSAGNVSSRMNVAGCGFVEMGFAFPSGGQGDAKSGGTYDYRGPKSVEALRDVILFAMGKTADKQGRKIQELVGEVSVLTSNVGLHGGSHGGNACGAVMGLWGQQFPELAWYVSMESPYGEGIAGAELGARRGRVCPAYDPDTGVLNLSKLAFAADLELRPFGAGRSGDPSAPALVGSLFFDMDGDGKCESEDDYRLQPLVFDLGAGRKSWYSVRLMREAEKRGLFGNHRPTHIPSLDEAVEFWRYRDATGLLSDAIRKVPNVTVIVVAGETDHVQIAPDHPHIRAQVNAFQKAGAQFIRLNPDRAYVEWLLDRKVPAVPDNNAGRQYTPKTIAPALCPDGGVPKQLLSSAAICELADRVQAGNFEPNLDRALFPDAPKTSGPLPGAGRRTPNREGRPPRPNPRSDD